MKRKETIGKGAVYLIAAVLVATFTLIPVAEIYAQEAFKVGAVFSVTGRPSFLGDPEKKTAMMLADQVNAAGGIGGHPLELIVYDDEGDPTKCALAVRKLITQDKVCAIIGPSLSGFSLAVLPEAEKHKVPLVSCAASYKIVNNEKTGKPYKWVFKVPQSDSMAVEAIYDHMKKKGIKGPEKPGSFNWYVIKDDNKEPKDWIVCKEGDLHRKDTIGTIFDQINEWVKDKFKLTRPVDFTYDKEEEESLDIEESKVVDGDGVDETTGSVLNH